MYAVVGCNRCSSLWLLEDPEESETATCPRCGKRHRVDRLRRLFESEDREAAREARSRLLADRGNELDAVERLGTVEEQARRAEDAGVDDREFLEAAGVDVEAVERAGDVSGGGSTPRDELVREALREQERPTAEEVLEYAAARGVPESAARDLLDRLVREGAVTERDGRYRLL